MGSANYKASPPFIFSSTQPQQALIIFLLCIAFLTSFFIIASSTGNDTSRRGCIKAERDALLAFKAETIYDKAHPISTWGDQTDDCCQWAGVRCDNNSGHVIRLNPHLRRPPRPKNYDYEYYYDNKPGLRGNISVSLIGLQHLTYLNLRGNCFNNTSIPKWLGSLESLVHLDLSFNCFTAVIPHELGNLTKLRYLNLATYYERLKAVDDAEWLSGLSSLRYLSMNHANFSGVDNVIQSLNKLHHLKHVSLVGCSMSSIPESLSHLNFTSLTSMNISRNMFDNMSIPEWLFRIPNLRHLRMSDCGWTGTIPSSVRNATSLQFLDLSWNEGISCDMQRGLIGDLCNLQQLYLDGTFVGKSLEEDFRDAFSGCIRRNLNVLSFVRSSLKGPLPDWLGEFTNLTDLFLSINFLHGSMPESLERLSRLQYLSLYGNALNGPIPESLSQLSNLVGLELSDNNFNYSSVITKAHLANLTNLKYLSFDQLVLNISIDWIPRFQALYIDLSSCDIGPKFPVWLANQVNLDRLDISNTGIKDLMPDWFWNITYTMTYLDLSNNEINGRLPQHLKFQREQVRIFLSSNHFEGSVPYFPPNVLALDLSNNSLSGTIPSDLGNFGGRTPQLQSLSLSSNNLTGSIPNSLCNLVGLVSLELSNNHLEGAIPNCWNNLAQLQYLILANNSLEGEVPDTLVSSSQSLQVLHLSNNQLHGGFPSFLKKCTSMATLALDHNNLSGHIPTWVGETMTSLMIMTLKQNNFSGHLPLLSNLASLHFLDLSQNSFVGSIPQSYGNLMGMTNISMNGGARFANYTGEVLIKIIVSTKGIELPYGVSLSSFKFIDLSANNLSGQIPKTIVNLVGLQNLDLSYNHLSGEIPRDIGLMQSLESLDLSRNELNGSIPPGLGTLDFLQSLNLSHNNLSGKIPYASHLTTFIDPSVYDCNLNLCGAPLDKNCTSDEPPSNSHDQQHDGDDNDDSPTIWFCIGLASGFVVGSWIVWGVLLFKKEWRYTYFKFLDHIYDMMYVKMAITIAKIKGA